MKAGWAAAVVGAGAALAWALSVPRSELAVVWGVGALLALLAAGWHRWGPADGRAVLVAAVALRLVAWAVPETPQLSEDWVRYAWDGWALNEGVWPVGVVPEEAQRDLAWDANAEWMLGQMNSPQYPGVYPPAAQVLFALPWRLGAPSPHAWWRAFQGLLALLDGLAVWGLIRLLRRSGRSGRGAAWYAFHPLVLFEGVGNGHLEVVVLAVGVGVALAWPHRPRAAALGALAMIAFKWMPVLGVPAWAWSRRAHWRREGWVWVVWAAAAGAFAWMAWASMRLFIDRFEFNAGPYFFVRGLIMQGTPYNPIRWLGPVMTALGGVAVLWAATRSRWTLAQRWTAGWALWLTAATTVHPWYALYLVPLSLFTPWRWPLLAAGVVALSYANYLPGGVRMEVVAVEWAVIAGGIWLDHRRLNGSR